MEGGFPYGDVIIIAAIAAFIVLRYRAMLGEKSGRDPSQMQVRPLKEFERIIQLPGREAAKAQQKTTEPDYGAFTETYGAMKAVDKNFSPEEFLQGAKAAFEMVIAAFNEADHDTLKMLLSSALYENFNATLAAQQAQGKKQQATLVAITTAEVTEAKLEGATARIAVRFVSEQIILLRDEQGVVLEGDPSRQEAVEDRWVFERALNSNDPAWKIIET